MVCLVYVFSSSQVWMWELDHNKGWTPKNWWFWTVVLEKTLESPLDCKEIKPSRKSVLNIHWKDLCWSWNCSTWVTWCKEPTHWKRSWWWDRLKSGRKGDDRGWDGLMPSPTRWTWVWASSGSWWWTGNPGICGVTMSRTWRSNWTELNWPPKSNSLGVLVPLACPQV